jgi:hypothetical protein
MGLDDKKTWKIDKPIGIQSDEERKAMNTARQRDQFLGKISREARKNKDLAGYLAAEKAGYTNRGIENVDDKNARYLEKANQRRFWGDRGVGPGQPPAGGAQQPTEGSQPPNVGTPPATGSPPAPSTPAAPSAPSVTLPDGRTYVPGKGIALGDGAFQQVSMPQYEPATPAAPATTTGGQPAAPAKPKSFFEKRASGRQAFVDTVGTLRGKEGGMTSKEKEQAQAQGAALGLTPQQIQETLDGETELSPEKIADRAQKRKDEAKKRKDEAYQKEFGGSDEKIEKAIAGLDKSKFSPEQIAQIRKNMAGLAPQERKEITDKSASNAATANSETDKRTKEFLDLIPKAKQEIQGLIDADLEYQNSESQVKAKERFDDYSLELDKRDGPWGDLSEEQKNKQRSEFSSKFGKDWYEKYGVGRIERIDELKKLRGSTSGDAAQKSIMDDGGVVSGRGGVELDPVIPSGNPLFDNPNADSVAWARGSVIGKKKKPKVKKDLSPQASIQRVEVDDLFNSLNKSESKASLMSRPLVVT